jgi:hypothetical protein
MNMAPTYKRLSLSLSLRNTGHFHGKRIHGVGDAVAATIAVPLLEVLAPADASVKMRTLTRAMMASAMSWVAPTVEVLENDRILERGGSEGDGWIVMPYIDVVLGGDDKGALYTLYVNNSSLSLSLSLSLILSLSLSLSLIYTYTI